MSDVSPSRFERLVEDVTKNYPDADRSLFDRAYSEMGERVPGPRVHEALEVASMLASMRLEPSVAVACLVRSLRDVIPQPDLVRAFGSEIGAIVEGVARVEAIRWDRIEQETVESLRKMLMAMAAEIRVVIIVLACRVQRMRSLADPEERMDVVERRCVARESLAVFAPLANRLGLWQFKREIEDYSLRELEPETYAELEKLLVERRQGQTRILQRAMVVLREKLSEQGIAAVVNGRSKHSYSVFRKMQRKGVGLDQIHDVSAVRVITEQLSDCYMALGLVHSIWVPLPGQFDDYIAKPKDNHYQSLHTTVMGPEGKPLEIQIRTREMHEFAEYGVAAHWAYKEGRKAGSKGADQRFLVMRQLMDWERDVVDLRQQAERLKTDVFRDQVYVFTPAGDVVELPQGATPLDFAYRIHTMVGHRFRGARINDQIVPLNYQLKTGDRVEILTRKKPSPSRDWLNPASGSLFTTSAKAKVRLWFREQGRDAAVQHGRETVEREIQRMDLAHVTLADLVERFEYKKDDDLFAAIGFGIRSAQAVASVALQIERERATPVPPPPEPAIDRKAGTETSSQGLSLCGVDDIEGRRAGCCCPVPGDAIVGFISRGRGIIIHRKDCSHANVRSDPDRWVEIGWGASELERYPVTLDIVAHDRSGLLCDLSELVAQAGANVRSIHGDVQPRNNSAKIRMSLDIVGADQVVRVLDKLNQSRDVVSVRRVGEGR